MSSPAIYEPVEIPNTSRAQPASSATAQQSSKEVTQHLAQALCNRSVCRFCRVQSIRHIRVVRWFQHLQGILFRSPVNIGEGMWKRKILEASTKVPFSTSFSDIRCRQPLLTTFYRTLPYSFSTHSDQTTYSAFARPAAFLRGKECEE